MREHLTQSVEDYLKSIYELTEQDERVSTNRIAKRLGVKAGTVTGMLQRLAANEPPLLDYHKHHGVELTQEGERVALEIIRHHRLLELFLHKTLGYSWDEVHAEADRLEHVISEDLEERIAQALGNPQHDPHGDPIPSRDLHLPLESAVPLASLRPGQAGTVHRVGNENPDLLRYLQEIGVVPQAHLAVRDYSSLDENLSIEIDGRMVVLGPRISEYVYVEVDPA